MITKVTRKFIISSTISLTGFQCCCRVSVCCLTGFQCVFQNSVHIICFRINICLGFFFSRNFLLSLLLLLEPGLATSNITSSGRQTTPSRPRWRSGPWWCWGPWFCPGLPPGTSGAPGRGLAGGPSWMSSIALVWPSRMWRWRLVWPPASHTLVKV